jgi:hypothetical protein
MWYFEKGAGCGWSQNPICKKPRKYDAKFEKEKQDKTSYLRCQHLKNYDAKVWERNARRNLIFEKVLGCEVVMLWLESQKPKILS